MSFKQISDIQRYPVRKNDLLQGWDAADELILEHLKELDLNDKRVLIINDQFGALSCGLAEFDCTTYTDSYISWAGIHHNSDHKIRPFTNLNDLQGLYDFVIMRIPKNMSFLEDILAHLTHHLHPNSQVICGSMVKHLPSTSFDLLKRYIGETTTSLAKKKARLIFAKFEKEIVTSPYPMKVNMDGFGYPFTNHSNLFSREKLDIGSRFFLEHIPRGDFKTILDLGCANGIIGIRAKELNPKAQIIFSDESAMAIESAKLNYQNHFTDEARFIWTNCFENQTRESLDLILCNPPFHQGHTIGDFIAQQMFRDAHAALRSGGILRVIGNSHLGYGQVLKKFFGNMRVVASNKKFIVYEAKCLNSNHN
jgi:23S rRNA (guanine1835-N2)-methyltransferase